MNQDYPQLAQSAKSSVSQLTSSGASLWLGGTIAPPTGRTRSKLTGPGGLNGLLIVAAIALATFGIRRGSRH